MTATFVSESPILLYPEVMTPTGLKALVLWQHPDGRWFATQGDTVELAYRSAAQLEREREDAEAEMAPARHVTKENGDCASWCEPCRLEALERVKIGGTDAE